MRLQLSKAFMKPGPLQRGIATFFLVFTFMDLVFIDVLGQRGCLEESLSLPVLSTSVKLSEATKKNETPRLAIVKAANYDEPLHPDGEAPLGCFDEDCFCCCSHLIPSVSLDLNVLNGPIEASISAISPFPLSPLHGTYHPPRLS